jgi:hypothetical protein
VKRGDRSRPPIVYTGRQYCAGTRRNVINWATLAGACAALWVRSSHGRGGVLESFA